VFFFIGSINFVSDDKKYICYTNPNLPGSSEALIIKFTNNFEEFFYIGIHTYGSLTFEGGCGIT